MRMTLGAPLLAVLLLASCGRVENTLTVKNTSGVTAAQVTVKVCTRSYGFTNLNDGESKTGTFTVDGDSGFSVSASLSDGTTLLTNSFGYVTGGAGAYGNHAEIEITKDRKITGKQK